MSNIINNNIKSKNSLDWLTINEAINTLNTNNDKYITKGDLYRNALSGNVKLSIYFQSPFALKKVKCISEKIKIRPVDINSSYYQCLNDYNLEICTDGRFIFPKTQFIDTPLLGYEYVILQHLLARSLGIPQPIEGANPVNYGISVIIANTIFQVFEREQCNDTYLPNSYVKKNHRPITPPTLIHTYKNYKPLASLPKDACFVIRNEELRKLSNRDWIKRNTQTANTRISSPLARLFWLSCKHNEAISPLIHKPYKLLSIFEQWASAEGITDRLSGDTLKAALERGSPTSTSPSK